jgi:hypothetical protein
MKKLVYIVLVLGLILMPLETVFGGWFVGKKTIKKMEAGADIDMEFYFFAYSLMASVVLLALVSVGILYYLGYVLNSVNSKLQSHIPST